jgi:hypothetical protein
MLSFALRSSLLPNASTGSHTSASYPFLCDVTFFLYICIYVSILVTSSQEEHNTEKDILFALSESERIIFWSVI